MKKLLYVLTGLCLLAGVFTACEKKPLDDPDDLNGGGGTTPTEQTGVISGAVSEEGTGLPLELALVELNPGEKRTVTDKNGEFSIEGLMPGNYALKVSKLGYKTVESGPITVKEGQTTRQEIKMEKEQTDLRIVDEEGNDLETLEFLGARKLTFKILNSGTNILEWEIPVVATEWVKGFSKESGKLSPGASVAIEIELDIPDAPDEEAIVYILSNAGNKQLKLVYKFPVEVKDVEDYTETAFGLNMEMVGVKGGAFQMGATSEQGSDAESNEKPVHDVALSSYYIGKYEVTQAQWEAVMGYNPSEFEGRNRPVEWVSWGEAQIFCKQLSEMTGKTYRLPTEAEWEYAARGGNKSQHYKYAGSNNIDGVAWYGNSYDHTHQVGTKKANELGIYDMSGNVWEWCSDRYGEDYYSSSPAVNPQGPESGSYRVIRGGGCRNDARSCRVSERINFSPDRGFNFLGIRVACSSK